MKTDVEGLLKNDCKKKYKLSERMGWAKDAAQGYSYSHLSDAW